PTALTSPPSLHDALPIYRCGRVREVPAAGDAEASLRGVLRSAVRTGHDSTPSTISATSVGVVPTRTPAPSSASAFDLAVPAEPVMIAPACPIRFPGGAVNPAM